MSTPASAPASTDNTVVSIVPTPAQAAPEATPPADEITQSIDALLATPAGAPPAPAAGAVDATAIASAVAQAMAAMGVAQPAPQAAPAIDPAVTAFMAQQSDAMKSMMAQITPTTTPSDPFADALDVTTLMQGVAPEAATALLGTEGMAEAIAVMADNAAKARAGSMAASLPTATQGVDAAALSTQMADVKKQMFTSQLTGIHPALMAKLGTPEGQAYMNSPNPYSAGHTNKSFFDMAASNMDMASAVHILTQIPEAPAPATPPLAIGGGTPPAPAVGSGPIPITTAMHARVLQDFQDGKRSYADVQEFEARMAAQHP